METLAQQVTGRTIQAVGRRGKYLMLSLDPSATLIIHLRMTGQLAVVAADGAGARGNHLRAWFDLADGRRLTFTDARKFGRIWLVADAQSVIGKLGPEPLDWTFTADQLATRLQGRRGAIKGVLLDQTIVAGVGNIYADEALFVSGVHPLRPAADLSGEEIRRLHEAIRLVLRESIEQRGTLLRDYRTPYGGEDGGYQNRLRVYRHTGDACPSCGTSIERIRVT